jgi:hypothetical protein
LSRRQLPPVLATGRERKGIELYSSPALYFPKKQSNRRREKNEFQSSARLAINGDPSFDGKHICIG